MLPLRFWSRSVTVFGAIERVLNHRTKGGLFPISGDLFFRVRDCVSNFSNLFIVIIFCFGPYGRWKCNPIDKLPNYLSNN